MSYVKRKSIELPESLPYTGEPQYGSIKVKIGNHVLVEDEDYAAYYSDCTDVGDVTISIFGIGRYDGETSSTYKIISDDKEKPVAPVSETDTKVDTKTPSKTEVGTIHEFGGNTVQILSANTVAFTKAENKRSVTVPATVTIQQFERCKKVRRCPDTFAQKIKMLKNQHFLELYKIGRRTFWRKMCYNQCAAVYETLKILQ